MLDYANPGTFATVFIALYVAHGVADHWLQTDYQAATKGKRDWEGVGACATHVGVYILAASVLLFVVDAVFGLELTVAGVLIGQAISAVTHYWADRRFTLARLCDRLGIGGFYRLGAPREVVAYTNTDLQRVELYRRENAPSDQTWHRQMLVSDHQSWDNPSLGTGAYVLEQWWHIFWLFIAAIVTVIL